jgi:flagellar protein FlgJ
MVPRQASFRAYPSLDAAVQDFVALIGNSPRYQSAIGVGDDAAAYARGLLAGGYATDTEYARKLEAVAASPSAAAAFDASSQPARLRLFATQG